MPMFDQYKRRIDYLRISVTDRCNLRCVYCMPEEGITLIDHRDILTFEEITEFTRCAVSMGITKARLTGGEPLARKGIVNLVRMLAAIEGIEDFSMTTNAILLSKYALELKTAGLGRVNISLDTVDAGRYKQITRGGNIQEVFAGIEAAKNARLQPVKINCVIKKSIDESDAVAVQRYGDEHGLTVRFIYEMDIEKGAFSGVHGGTGGDCAQCNRLRLTSDGFLKPCLFNDISVNIRTTEYREAIQLALLQKPERGLSGTSHKFYNIGG
jgi:cyclic pyranopterin phosphate synthase